MVRFYCDREEQPGESGQCWRVAVRHVQTGEERQFHQPAEALAYLEQMAEQATSPKQFKQWL